ncbi:MAG: DUF6774 domain-containing protein [Eubacterium sp.]
MDGCSINLTVSALACAIAKGKSNEEVALLAVFFTQLGDSLQTIATTNEICCNQSGSNDNNSNTLNRT